MRFAVVELARRSVIKDGRNFKRLAREVETDQPKLWYNPILIVIPEDFDYQGADGEVEEMKLEELVVAAPRSNLGYGAQYRKFVAQNRRKFGLA